MPAFQGAVDLGYRYFELDVHATRDGKVIVFHDHDLDRLTDGTGWVWDHDWADLRPLDAAHSFDRRRGYPRRGEGIRIPLLEEILTTFPDVMVNVELKQDGIEEAVADELRRLDAFDRVMIGSFSDARIALFREVTKGAVATSAGQHEVRRLYSLGVRGRPVDTEADAVQVPARYGGLKVPTRRFIRAIHEAGKQIHVWTVNSPSPMKRLLAAGVDGIMTDRPDLLNEVVASSK